jgi:hypothetical protein
VKLELKGTCPNCHQEITVPVSVQATPCSYDRMTVLDFDCSNCGCSLVVRGELHVTFTVEKDKS